MLHLPKGARFLLCCDVAFFFKQWGGATGKAAGRTLDGQEWSQYPEISNGPELLIA